MAREWTESERYLPDRPDFETVRVFSITMNNFLERRWFFAHIFAYKVDDQNLFREITSLTVSCFEPSNDDKLRVEIAPAKLIWKGQIAGVRDRISRMETAGYSAVIPWQLKDTSFDEYREVLSKGYTMRHAATKLLNLSDMVSVTPEMTAWLTEIITGSINATYLDNEMWGSW